MRAFGPCISPTPGPEGCPLSSLLALEQVLRRQYGKEVDIWSAGVILYILLSGVPPFWGDSEDQIFVSATFVQSLQSSTLSFRTHTLCISPCNPVIWRDRRWCGRPAEAHTGSRALAVHGE